MYPPSKEEVKNRRSRENYENVQEYHSKSRMPLQKTICILTKFAHHQKMDFMFLFAA
uniref:Uncharacterized protein n=1 Tax=Candidatus Kentrum sp. TUN TaxID=2126343 RepID=A0A451A294_9GAMM|nr:MAG: hypothetical protein BECKTUN1418F_GA0071002_12033 [Candidatus Kentron sp. TUN]